MKVFLATTWTLENRKELIKQCDYILESFFYIKEWQIPICKAAKGFLLDSGAFSFMNGRKATNIEKYAEDYANFVKEYDIRNYFELDIESIVGWDNYLRINDQIEKITKIPSIPVFHKERGWDWFVNACKTHSYVAFGGIAINGPTKNKTILNVMPQFIKTAHKQKAIIHGLGFTSIQFYDKIRFDTVDSTTWTAGCRFGKMYAFTGSGLKVYDGTKNGQRYKSRDELNAHNFEEWIKYQKWADKYLKVLY